MDADEPKPEPKPKPDMSRHPSVRVCDHDCCEQPGESTHRHIFDPDVCPLCNWKDLL